MTPEIWKLLSDTQSIDHLRGAMSDGHLAIMEAEGVDEILANFQEWIDVEFEVALDSGSTDNVCHGGRPWLRCRALGWQQERTDICHRRREQARERWSGQPQPADHKRISQ